MHILVFCSVSLYQNNFMFPRHILTDYIQFSAKKKQTEESARDGRREMKIQTTEDNAQHNPATKLE